MSISDLALKELNTVTDMEYWTNRRYDADGTGKAHKTEQGDYMKGDVLYCGKCNTPKFHYVGYGMEKYMRCVCKCEKDDLSAYNEKRKYKEDADRIRAYRKDGIPEGRLRDYTFANAEQNDMYDIAKSYADAFDLFYEDGTGLIFYGPCGTGKTFYAAAIANELIDRMIPCKVTNFATISNELQSETNRQAYIDSFKKYKLLVIDDFGVERDTAFMDEVVYQIVNARYETKKPIIVTTNLTRDELNHPNSSAKRIISRLCGMIPKNHRIEFVGDDRRTADASTV